MLDFVFSGGAGIWVAFGYLVTAGFADYWLVGFGVCTWLDVVTWWGF